MQAGCDELTTIRRAGEVWAGVAQRGERAVGGAVYPGVRGEEGESRWASCREWGVWPR